MIRRKLTIWLAALSMVAVVGGSTMAVATPQTSYAKCSNHLLTFPAWYKGLLNGDCEVKSPSSLGKDGLRKFIMVIAFNILEILLQAAAYVSAFLIIYGGFRSITDAGSPDSVVRARKTVINAVIGLVIALLSVAIVNLISGAVY